MDNYHNNWIQTYSGKVLHVFKPQSDEIAIVDIANALSKLPRFGGHTKVPYWVAQHCVLVANTLVSYPLVAQLYGLLHDAEEYAFGDMPSPIKCAMPEYRKHTDRMKLVILGKYFKDDFGLYVPLVKFADEQLLATERRDLMYPCDTPWTHPLPEPHMGPIKPWTSEQAEYEFISKYISLANALGMSKLDTSYHNRYIHLKSLFGVGIA
jgi:uncharacterized protein